MACLHGMAFVICLFFAVHVTYWLGPEALHFCAALLLVLACEACAALVD